MSIDGSESVTGTGMIGENEQEKKMQVCKATFFFYRRISFLLAFEGPSVNEIKNSQLIISVGKSFQRKSIRQ